MTPEPTRYPFLLNVVAQVLYAVCPNAPSYTSSIQFGISGFFVSYAANLGGSNITNLPIITGPATISLLGSATSGYLANAFCTIQTTPATSIVTNSVPFVPSNAVVIPADNGGPVTIVLESSVDLVNWTAALPGTYGTSSSTIVFSELEQMHEITGVFE